MDIQTFWSALTGTGAVALVFGFWIKNYFGPYLKVKASNLATHEDIQLLIHQVRETELVKAEISDRVWDRQQRWAFKRDIYMQLLETLNKLYETQMFVHWNEEDRKQGKSIKPEHLEKVESLLALLRQFHHLRTIAAVVIDTTGYKIVREVTDEDKRGGQDSINFYRDTLERLTIAARKDLGYEPESTTLPDR
jgi:hypothetical protein